MVIDYVTVALIATRQHVRSRVDMRAEFYQANNGGTFKCSTRAFESDVEKVKAQNCLMLARENTKLSRPT